MQRRLFNTLIILIIVYATGYSQDCNTGKPDPRISAFLKFIDHDDLSLEELRKLPLEVLKNSAPPPKHYPETDVKRMKITADSIPVLVFNPLHRNNLPIIINYHGGGFISPLLPFIEHSLWLEAKAYNAVVVAVDYRVAPENPFPAAVDDCYNAFLWVAENGKTIGGDTNKIMLIGNSAGANLAAVISQKAKKAGLQHKIKLHVMNGLPADLRPSNMETSVSYRQNASGYFQSKAMCYLAVEMYAPGQYNNPEVSPILSEDFRGLPPAVIINAEFDPLRDDGISYAKKLREAGVKVWEKCFPGQIHCLIGLPDDAAEITEFQNIVKSAMKEIFK